MIRSEFTHNGILTHIIIDNGNGTGERTNYNPDGTIESVVQITDLPIFDYEPLDNNGALATLLVVLNLVSLEDASNAIHAEPEHLIAEAQAWEIASQ